MSVGVNPPKTPVTKGSNGIATATLPNMCKMPGPPAPFVPAPLPNIGKSGDKPKGYTKKVKVEGNPVAIKGASFCSMGDMPSKATGGGMVSANTHGPCKFISPGSMDVKFEGKNVHLLADLMTNNGGGSGSPANSATMMGAVQLSAEVKADIREQMKEEKPICPEGNAQFFEHEWKEEPREPRGSTKETIETLQNSANEDDAFEGYGAAKNVEDGDLTIPDRDRTSKVSREPTNEERENGAAGDDHKVFRHCTRGGCRHKSEIDHKIDEGQAECKNGNQFKDFKQMRRNASIQRQTGCKFIYKINGNKEHADYVEAQIEYAARVSNFHVTIKKIF